MKKTFIHLFLLTFCLGFLLTCKKEEKPLPPIVPLSKVFKDWTYYKKGSWWVYEDSATKKLDSSIVTSDRVFISESRDGRNKDIVSRVETFKYITYDFFYNKNYEYIGGSIAVSPFNHQEKYYRLKKYLRDTNNNILDQRLIFWLDTIVNSIEETSYEYSQFINIYDGLIINNITFTKVIKICLFSAGKPHYPQTYYYFTKNTGIIRKEINMKSNSQDPDNWQIWNLIKYHIIQ